MVDKKPKNPVGRRGFLNSFYYAGKGAKTAFQRERNIRVFVIVTVLVFLLAYFLNISTTEWLILIFIIGTNFIAELFNTAIEVLCDKVSPTKDALIANAKDISAAAVLLMSIASLAIGIAIFLPKILTFL